jgi:hypothetical protein
MWLAGASLLTIVLGSGDANADSFGTPGSGEYIIPSTGYYDFRVAGADGGGSFPFGGAGACCFAVGRRGGHREATAAAGAAAITGEGVAAALPAATATAAPIRM